MCPLSVPGRCAIQPVDSIQFGKSLLIGMPPDWGCPFRCIYCASTHARKATTRRRRYSALDLLLREPRNFLERAQEVECILLAGQGDPALHTGIGDVLRMLNARTSLPVAIRTTGVLLSRESISLALHHASHVIVKLDAINREMFHRVHRPHKGVRSARFVTGVKRFREDFTGSFLMETVLMEGVNDDASSIRRLFETLRGLEPHRVLLYLHTDADEEMFERRIRERGRLGEGGDGLPVVFITRRLYEERHPRRDTGKSGTYSSTMTWEASIHRDRSRALVRGRP
jgi:wyosine [tRNA(Phe)-imidazoG37] synthetase (radical SAM superfamily)